MIDNNNKKKQIYPSFNITIPYTLILEVKLKTFTSCSAIDKSRKIPASIQHYLKIKRTPVHYWSENWFSVTMLLNSKIKYIS